MSRSQVCILSLIFGLLAFGAVSWKHPTAPVQCIMISDIHFNPFYDGKLLSMLEKFTYDKWQGVFEASDSSKMLCSPGQDANYGLLISAVQSMRSHFDDEHMPAFIVISGDMLWHENNDPVSDKKRLIDLKKKTMQFLADLFQREFHGVPIIPALGNNDSDGGDYAKQSPDFLATFADAWHLADQGADIDSFKKYGYYTARCQNLKMVVLNTTLVSNDTNRYNRAAADYHQSYQMDGLTMLQWLEKQLSAGDKGVWIVSHIPPGDDGYGVYKNDTLHPKFLWNKQCNRQMDRLITTYAGSIKYFIAAHTHFNELRVIHSDSDNRSLLYIRMVPSIAPNHKNNPSFEIADLDSAYNVTGYNSFYMNLAAKDTTWQLLPQVAQLQSGSPDTVYNYLNSLNPVSADYTRFYNVGTNSPIVAQIIKADVVHVKK